MKVTRGSYDFEVVDSPVISSWNYWGLFSNGTWEPGTFKALDQLLSPGDLMFDVGAWIGPLALWEARRGVKVVALEPDPVAYELLCENIRLSGLEDMIIPKQLAVWNKSESVLLHFNEQGDSKSRIYTEIFTDSIEVEAKSLEGLIFRFGVPATIKMDIEGAESEILPSSGPFLREKNIPLVLSLHEIWYNEGTREAMDEELKNWDMVEIDKHNSYVCRPK